MTQRSLTFVRFTREAIALLLRTDNKAVERAITRLYSFQTATEQATQNTLNRNGAGFSAADASKGSYYAKWIAQGRSLSGRHLNHARSMVLKYTKQLADYANANYHP